MGPLILVFWTSCDTSCGLSKPEWADWFALSIGHHSSQSLSTHTCFRMTVSTGRPNVQLFTRSGISATNGRFSVNKLVPWGCLSQQGIRFQSSLRMNFVAFIINSSSRHTVRSETAAFTVTSGGSRISQTRDTNLLFLPFFLKSGWKWNVAFSMFYISIWAISIYWKSVSKMVIFKQYSDELPPRKRPMMDKSDE